MDFPREAIKGVPNKNDLVEEQYASATLFQFQDRKHIQREDECLEESINWNDNDEALTLLLQKRRVTTGEIHFKGGAFIIPRERIDDIRAHPLLKKHFSYERQQLADNEYHGNLLLKKTAPPDVKKQVINQLAFACGFGNYVSNDLETE